ncbi:MAG: calcineurin-like phosphoesterase family protein [Planctomycetota bacterium]
MKTTLTAAIILAITGTATANEFDDIARGTVFLDENQNGLRDAAEPGIRGVRVSNGIDVVLTDDAGRYELPVTDDTIVFVIKPRDYKTPVNEDNLPRFYYIHKPAGSPTYLNFRGVDPTGPLPTAVDLPLIASPEPDRFDILVFGDTQPYSQDQINYITHDVIEEVVGIDAAFGISLGDLVGDNLGFFHPINDVVSTIGIPFHNVYGNHDMNFDVSAENEHLADETFERVYGPTTYSFDYGPVHFIIFDNVLYLGEGNGYWSSVTEKDLTFIANSLATADPDQQIVLASHIPWNEINNLDKLLGLLDDFPHTFSLSSHWHKQHHWFFGSDRGFDRPGGHHHLVHNTVSGSWWNGAPDEFGIPHTMMRDGGPNGYSIITFDDNGIPEADGKKYSIRYKAAGKPADEQMHIFLDSVILASDTAKEVVVNFWAGSERCTVEMRVPGQDWTPLEYTIRPDPYFEQLKARETMLKNRLGVERLQGMIEVGSELPNPNDSTHIWTGTLPAGLPKGGHAIEFRATDIFGQTHSGVRIIHVR